MVLQHVLQKCKSDHQDLQALFDELVDAAGWEKAWATGLQQKTGKIRLY